MVVFSLIVSRNPLGTPDGGDDQATVCKNSEPSRASFEVNKFQFPDKAICISGYYSWR